MRILWITNIEFPEALSLLSVDSCHKKSGGWMLGAADALISSNSISHFCVATVSEKVDHLTKLVGKSIVYYLLPLGKGNKAYNSEYEALWKRVQDEVNPNVVHIHGTEYSHGLAYMKACGTKNVVISIQGLTSACHFYYMYGIEKCDIIRSLSFRDLIKGTIFREKRAFLDRSKYEEEMIRMTNFVIGRTSWDKARIWAINPSSRYFACNETLRNEFYDGESWEYEKCEKHSIFLSQAGYPIKGLHQLLKAMPLVLSLYPDACIRIAGNNFTKYSSIKDFLRISGYGRYVNRLIRKNCLETKVFFTGNLDASQMKQEYLRANVFLCPSSIENSPNSLCEAQILGTPVVAAYVGGVSDLMKEDEDHLYRYEEIAMLAKQICEIFANNHYINKSRFIASQRHSREQNAKNLLSIYEHIIHANENS